MTVRWDWVVDGRLEYCVVDCQEDDGDDDGRKGTGQKTD